MYTSLLQRKYEAHGLKHSRKYFSLISLPVQVNIICTSVIMAEQIPDDFLLLDEEVGSTSI
jgi:hypothetical protein